MRLRTGWLLVAMIGCGAAQQGPAETPQPVAAEPRPAPAPASAAPAEAQTPASPAVSASPLHFASKPVSLPGATGRVSLDYLAVDRKNGWVWIPAGGTGSVDVLEVATGKVTRIAGFPTADREGKGGGKIVVGPSSVTIGNGFAYVGNRANSQVCAIDTAKLSRAGCITLASPPDGLAYVPSTLELWATTPGDKSITIVDVSSPTKLRAKGRLALDGTPEGYAVDDEHGTFYTNLEDRDKTTVIDVKTRKIVATFDAQCGAAGPRGLAIDGGRGLLFVACTDHVEVLLDVAHSGTLLSKLDTGAGVDNIDYLASRRQLFVAAGKAGTLTVAAVDDKGTLTLVGTGPGAPGGRVVVVDDQGVAYVADPAQGAVLAVSSSR